MKRAARVQPQSRVLKTSLRNKIVLMALGIAMLASVTMGVATYRRSASLAEDLGTAKLAGETKLVAEKLSESLRNIQSDTSILSLTPPIEGIIRAGRSGGTDPLDGSSLATWKSRLATIFSSMLRVRPAYSQIRFIGTADGGREIVRVNRRPDGFEVVEESKLQTKGHRPFVKLGLTLSPGEWSFSDVSIRWDFGREEEDGRPNIRGLYPIFDAQGKRFGVIVINADYEILMQEAIAAAQPTSYTIVANSAGDYIVYDPVRGPSNLRFHFDENYMAPAPLSSGASADDRGLIRDGNHVFYESQTVIDLARKNLVLDVFTRISKAALLAPADEANLDSLLLGIVLLVITCTVAFWLARLLTRPLQDMTKEVERFGQGNTQLHLPVGQPDEIGALARAFQDVTGDLLESEAKIRAIIDNVADGLIVTDSAGKIEMSNPAFRALFGYSGRRMTGRDVADLLPGGLQTRHGRMAVEIEARRADGTTFEAELSVSKLRVNGRELYCGIVRDVSERKKVERMKNEFVSTVNHELRTPLTSIAGSLSLLQAKAAGKLDAKSARLIELAQTGAERLSRLVNDILDVEKIQAGKIDYRVEEIDLVTLVPEVIARAEPLADRYAIDFTFDSSLASATVEVDPDRFEQALVNLLSNGAKYTPAGDVVDVRISSCGRDEQVCVSVTDHGPGIPKEFEKDVFERFTQADASGAQNKGSSGLGLYITKTLVDAFGGTIRFTTEEGKGTTFYVHLPLIEPLALEERKIA
ncbi:Sensor histidine kinase YycG [Methyloligella halotolerans]|uniref:histidine kinase n=1 Tax=Methyloligella halotolerans TaxID=1177755 RepID=A0A1E2S0I7_9HYPH|nr:ATP-binding protein [Methyloligella halotolerans]ODA67848.1 Sensor histidine kinase YycG [Methyloligella halotolerans]